MLKRIRHKFLIRIHICSICLVVIWTEGLAQSQILIRDNLNRQIKITRKVERIVCLQPELLRILVALGKQNKVVAVDRFPVNYDHLAKIIFPEVVKLPVVSVTGEDANLERILSLNPDLVLVSPSELNLSRHLSRKLNCPVVSLSSVGRLDRLLEELEILARITGSEKRGAELKNFMLTRLDFIKKRLSVVVEARKPKVYLSFWGSLLRSPVFYEPVEVAGGYNLARELRPIHQGSDTAVLTIETILNWDPEIILVHGNYPPTERQLTIEHILSDQRLQTVRAVKDRKVYYTFGFWYWWDPALVLVECYYLSQVFHPGLKPAFDLREEAEAIFKQFYGREGLFLTLCDRIEAHDWLQQK